MKGGWIRAWAIQIVEMLAVSLAAALLYGVEPLDGILLWGLAPLAGLATACRAVQRGLLNYAAWLAPPACLFAAHYARWRFSPPAGAALLTAFLSLVGAAAGEVLTQQKRRKRRHKHH